MIRAEPIILWLIPTARQLRSALGGISRLIAFGIGGWCILGAISDRIGTVVTILFAFCAVVGWGDALERIEQSKAEAAGIPDILPSGNQD